MRHLLWIALVLLPLASAQDVPGIVRRSVERDAVNFQRFRNYTFQETTRESRFDKEGAMTSVKLETVEVLMLAGYPYIRLIGRDGRLLSKRKNARNKRSSTRNSPNA